MATPDQSPAPPGRPLAGRRVLVTGAPGDLGRAICRAAALAGADVVVHHLGTPDDARRLADELRTLGSDTLVVEADVSDPAQVTEMVRDVVAQVGGIDGLVNNAGVMDEQPFLETTLESWHRTIAVDLTGVFLVSQEVGRGMAERGSGAIVNIASQLAYKGGRSVAAYCAAKAGVLGLTRAMARDLGPEVVVNAVAPGPLETAMTSPFADGEWLAARTSSLVTERLGQPDEVAPAVVFLLGDGASLFHGQTLHPNGGGVMA